MRIFTRVQRKVKAIGPTRVCEIDGLDVLPYVRSRLAFADLAVRALDAGDYTCVLVDFPYFMNHRGWLELPLRMFPLISIASFRNRTGEMRSMAFAPNDAACAAAFFARKRSITAHCLDDSDMLNYPAEALLRAPPPPLDEGYLSRMGTEEYFAPCWERLDEAWAGATDQTRFFTRHRAQVFVEHLRGVMPSGGKCLLVCEYGLWWMLRRCLRSQEPPPARYLLNWTMSPGVLQLAHPARAWQMGLLDDYPAVNVDFWRSMQRLLGASRGFGWGRILRFPRGDEVPRHPDVFAAPPVRFEKARVLETRLSRILSGMEAHGNGSASPLSLRTSIQFIAYLKRLMVSRQSLVPLPASQLFHAAEGCAGRGFQRQLAEHLLRYPEAENADALNLTLKGKNIDVAGGDGVPIPEYERMISWHTGRPFADFHPQAGGFWSTELSIRERMVGTHLWSEAAQARSIDAANLQSRAGRYAVSADYHLHARACGMARRIVEHAGSRYTARRSWGSLKKGVHWKATLAASARGEPAIYVKSASARELRRSRMDEFTPVAFLLADDDEINQAHLDAVYDPNLARRLSDFQESEASSKSGQIPDAVYSVCEARTKVDTMLDGHLHRDRVAALVFLYTKPLMGVKRYDALAKRGGSYQCRTAPDEDPELWALPNVQCMLAWAVRQARDRVIVVARKGWRMPPNVHRMALDKGVKLTTLPISAWRPEFVERMRRMYYTSATLKRHPNRERLIEPFVE